MKTKICSKCKKEFPATSEYFAADKRIKCGLQGRCRDCGRQYNKKYREQNKEKVAEYSKKYREENKDYYKQYDKKYYEENKTERLEYGRKYSRKYRKENKEKVAEYNKRYYEENKTKPKKPIL